MDQHGYTASELSHLEDIVGQHPLRRVAHVSNGPWYGFNGVQALVLTHDSLYRVPQGYALRADRVLDTFLLSDIADPCWTLRRGERSGRVSFTVAGTRRSYASKWLEARELATDLSASLR